MSQFVYFVGKGYPHSEIFEQIRQFGYKIGLLQDQNITLKHPERYDAVIEIDFSSPDTILKSLSKSDITNACGLLCTYENYITAKAVIGDFLKLPTCTYESAMQCTDKLLMRQAFADKDPAITHNFGLATTLDEALEIAKNLSYPLILKPTNLVKSLLIMKCRNEQELTRNFLYALSHIAQLYEKYHVYNRAPRLIIEEFITGKTCSIAAFVDQTGKPHFCEGIVSLTTAQEKGMDDSFLYARQLPADFSEELSEQMFAVARKGIEALDIKSTPAHVELIYNEKGVKLIEIGARIGGYRPRMYDYSYGVNMVKAEIALAVGMQPSLTGIFKSHCAVYELFPPAEGYFEGLEGVQDSNMYEYFSVKAEPKQKIGPAKVGYKATAVIIVNEPSAEAFSEKCATIDAIQVKVS